MHEVSLILSNGIIEDYERMKARLSDLPNPFVIAADGGSRHAKPLDLEIDVMVGDLDSTESEARSNLQDQETRFEIFPPDKDEIDLELAILFAIEEMTERIIILGAIGGRVDMTLANIFLLAHPQFRSHPIEVWHAGQTAWFVGVPGGRIRGEVGDGISLIPIGGDVEGISTIGLEYSLQNDGLVCGKPRGISNVMTQPEARIEFSSGGLIVVHTRRSE